MRNSLAVLVAILGLACSGPESTDRRGLRVATFNVAMGLNTAGELQQNLLNGDDENLKKVAAKNKAR